MACPFFMPTQKLDGGWLHPARLPLGAGWSGTCSAPGHEGTSPVEAELREFCNLGYATTCSRLPELRSCDAVRFSVASDRGTNLVLWFVCETGHRPSQYGTLQYDVASGLWTSPHPDPRILKMAECYVQSYLLRKIGSAPADFPARPNA